jgi:hypothetical protein
LPQSSSLSSATPMAGAGSFFDSGVCCIGDIRLHSCVRQSNGGGAPTGSPLLFAALESRSCGGGLSYEENEEPGWVLKRRPAVLIDRCKNDT